MSERRLAIKTVEGCPFCPFSEIIHAGDDPTSGWRMASFSGRLEDKELIRCKLNPRSRWRPLWTESGRRIPASCKLVKAPLEVHKLVPDHKLNRQYVPVLEKRP